MIRWRRTLYIQNLKCSNTFPLCTWYIFYLKFCLEPDCSKPSFKKLFRFVMCGCLGETVRTQCNFSSVFPPVLCSFLREIVFSQRGSAVVLAWLNLSGTCLRLFLSVVRLLTTSEIDSKLSNPCTPSWGLIRYIQRLNEYKSGTQNVPLKGMSCGNSTCVYILPGVSAHSLLR